MRSRINLVNYYYTKESNIWDSWFILSSRNYHHKIQRDSSEDTSNYRLKYS